MSVLGQAIGSYDTTGLSESPQSAQSLREQDHFAPSGGLTPTHRPASAATRLHNIEVRREMILVLRLRAPLLITIRGTQVRNHDGDGFPSTSTIALPRSSDVAEVGDVVTLSAPGTTVAAGAPFSVEEALRRGCGEKIWAGRLLPGVQSPATGASAAATCSFQAIPVMLR